SINWTKFGATSQRNRSIFRPPGKGAALSPTWARSAFWPDGALRRHCCKHRWPLLLASVALPPPCMGRHVAGAGTTPRLGELPPSGRRGAAASRAHVGAAGGAPRGRRSPPPGTLAGARGRSGAARASLQTRGRDRPSQRSYAVKNPNKDAPQGRKTLGSRSEPGRFATARRRALMGLLVCWGDAELT
ncbi:unnamed protein product, partial [Prorocentrum cordatum]